VLFDVSRKPCPKWDAKSRDRRELGTLGEIELQYDASEFRAAKKWPAPHWYLHGTIGKFRIAGVHSWYTHITEIKTKKTKQNEPHTQSKSIVAGRSQHGRTQHTGKQSIISAQRWHMTPEIFAKLDKNDCQHEQFPYNFEASLKRNTQKQVTSLQIRAKVRKYINWDFISRTRTATRASDAQRGWRFGVCRILFLAMFWTTSLKALAIFLSNSEVSLLTRHPGCGAAGPLTTPITTAVSNEQKNQHKRTATQKNLTNTEAFQNRKSLEPGGGGWDGGGGGAAGSAPPQEEAGAGGGWSNPAGGGCGGGASEEEAGAGKKPPGGGAEGSAPGGGCGGGTSEEEAGAGEEEAGAGWINPAWMNNSEIQTFKTFRN
jgi:hypothetical protein